MAEIKKVTPSEVFTRWKRDENYKQKMGFTTKWPEQVRFKEGIQWPAVTKNTKNIPRITINKCDFIVENKKSNILSKVIKLVFKIREVPPDIEETQQTDELGTTTNPVMEELDGKAKDFTDLAQNTWEDVDQTQLNNDMVDDALTIGNGFVHYYFDSSYTAGKYTQTKGKLCGHSVNAMDVALGNPHLKPHQVQKQPYIIIKTNEDVDGLKEQSKKTGENWQLIVPDNDNSQMYDSGKQDIESPNKATCLTMYYREGKAVYWFKCTESAVIQKPRPLSPDKRDFTLYPVDHLVFKPKTKCVYGRSVIEDSINVQKAINFLYSMIAYGVQQTAWPKILAKAGALIQGITNEPGEIIYDHDKNNPQDSIKYMQPPNFSTMPPLLIDKLSEDLRQTTGTTEINSGEVLGANMAASAIIALQNQAQKPNEAYVKMLFASQKRIGKIWEEFFKCYYILPRAITSKDANGQLKSKVITPSDYADTEFEMDLDVVESGALTEAGQMSFVQTLYDNKDIDKYQFVKYAPDSLVPKSMKTDFEEEQKKAEQAQKQAELMGQQANEVIGQLSPEEQAQLQQSPEILNQVMGGNA